MKDEAIRRHLVKMPMARASDRRIAALLGCEAKNVSRSRRDMLTSGEIKRHDVDKERKPS